VEAGVARVIIAMVDPNPKVSGAGVRILEEAGIEVFHMPDFETQAREMNPGFCSRMERGLPFVRAKLGMSLDGRTALANGESQWITGEAARADVQRLRAQTSAILTGSGTALADDPRLTVRLDQLVLDEQEKVAAEHALASQPLRVLLDSRMRTPGTAQLFAGDDVLVFTSDPVSQNSLPAHIETIVAPSASSGLDLRYVLESLSRRGCNEVLIEAGPTLVGEFLRAGLLDELVVYMAPRLLGSDAKPMLELTGISSLNDTPTFDVIEVTPLGHDLRMLLRPAQR
jgi:diaminohydroxyphosphoribosylaminopyrimidine deaminase/5-amino-6-(5-phosphoribosylamino)uracil reductase